MKKLITFMMMLLVVISLHAYTIETSHGEIDLEVPDGYTLEEAYCEMAKLYLEERWDHEELIEKSKETLSTIDNYITENKELREQYSDLENKYENLVSLYEQKTKVKFLQPMIGAHIGSNSDFNSYSLGIDFGAFLFEKIFTYTSVSYPLQLTLGVDFKI